MEKPSDRLREELAKTPKRKRRKSFPFGDHTPPPRSPRSTSEDSSSNSTNQSPPRSVREAVHRLSIAVENLKVDADEAAFETSTPRHKNFEKKQNITTVNILRITDLPRNTESMYIHIHNSMRSFRTKSIDRDAFRTYYCYSNIRTSITHISNTQALSPSSSSSPKRNRSKFILNPQKKMKSCMQHQSTI